MVRIVPNSENSIDLDTDLNLFDDEDWSFTGNILNLDDDDSLEYFNDINDKDFENPVVETINAYAPIILVFMTIIVILLLVANVMGAFNTSKNLDDYDSMIALSADTNKLPRQDGNELTNDELVGVSTTLNRYFGFLNSGSENFSKLSDLCYDESDFFNLYTKYRQGVKQSFDVNDCYVRTVKKLTSQFTVGKIQESVNKDGTYYVYVKLNIPNDEDITKYMWMQSYNIDKYFQTKQLNKTTMMQFLLESFTETPINCSGAEYEIQFVKDGDQYKLVDDAFITNSCKNVWTKALYQLNEVKSNN